MKKALVISGSRIRNLLAVSAVLMTVLLSKTYYFGVVHEDIYRYVYYAAVLLLVLFSRTSKRKLFAALQFSLPMAALMLLNIILHRRNMLQNNINLVIGIMLSILFSALCAACVPVKKLSAYYIRIMLATCIISLPCWLVANIMPDVAMSFCQPGYNWTDRAGYSFFYTWGWYGQIFKRNSGPFWEGGAYQGFLMLALLMLLYDSDKGSVRHRKTVFVTLLFTIVTTKSTTALMLLFILCVFCWHRVADLLGVKGRNIRYAVIVVIAAAAIISGVMSQSVIDKFTDVEAPSGRIRLNDIVGGAQLSIQGGLMGLGETLYRDSMKFLAGIDQDDSAGLLAMIYTYGWIFGAYYIVLMMRIAGGYFGGLRRERFAICFMFLILHMTEGLWYQPVYLTLLFSGNIGRMQHRKQRRTDIDTQMEKLNETTARAV